MCESKHQKELIRLDKFCKAYDLNYTSFIIRRSNGTIPDGMISKGGEKNFLMVDLNFVKRRFRFRKKMILYIHDMYFVARSIVDTDAKLAQLMVDELGGSVPAWSMFLNAIFGRDLRDTNIGNFTLTDVECKAIRFFRRFERKMNKLLNGKFDIEKYLDGLMD